MSSESTASGPPHIPLTRSQRAQYMFLGSAIMIGGAVLSLPLGWIVFAGPVVFTVPWIQPVLGVCALHFALNSVWGAFLLARAVRGGRLTSEQALRNDNALRDQGGAIGVVFFPGISVLAFAITGGHPYLPDNGLWVSTWYIFLGFLWLVPAIILHELGHAAAASALGLGWSTLRIGPLEVFRSEGATRVRWRFDGGMGSTWGMVRIEPRAILDAPGRVAWTALAGPAVSFLCAGAHAATAYALGGTGPLEAHGLAALLWSGVLLHGAIGLFNLLPYRNAYGQPSDGAMCLMMRRLHGLSGRDRMLAELQLEQFSCRPRDWRASVESMLSAASGPDARAEVSASLQMFALAVLLDRGDFPAARELLARMTPSLEALPVPVAQEVRLQEVMLHALGDAPDTARARMILGEVGPHATDPLYPRLAEAAVLLSEGQKAESLAALQQWEETSQQGGRAAMWRSGNQWAIERLRATL
ncbi:MAG: hypothetical protein ABW123_09055 [Cystobacter sp.]